MLRCYDRKRFRMDACVIGSEAGYLAEEARSYGAEILFCPSRRIFTRFLAIFSECSEAKPMMWSTLTVRRGAEPPCVVQRKRECRYELRIFAIWGRGNRHGQNRVDKGRPLVVTGWGRHWVRRHATHIVAVSQAALDQRWPGWRNRSDRFLVWTAGVDTQRFSPFSNGRQSVTPPTIICVGNFFLRSKRQDMAIKIFAAVRRAVPQARLVFVGTGPHESACRDLVRKLGLSEAVDFLGPRNRTQIPALLQSSSVFLSCSESEGLPNVLLEAQATALPVVATSIPAHREVLSPAFHPYLFNSGELDHAATKIAEILTKPDLAEELGRAGREHVATHYSSTSCLQALEDYYVSWLDLGKGRP